MKSKRRSAPITRSKRESTLDQTYGLLPGQKIAYVPMGMTIIEEGEELEYKEHLAVAPPQRLVDNIAAVRQVDVEPQAQKPEATPYIESRESVLPNKYLNSLIDVSPVSELVPKSEPKPELKVEPTPEPKSELKVEPTPEPKSEPKSEPKPELKAKPKKGEDSRPAFTQNTILDFIKKRGSVSEGIKSRVIQEHFSRGPSVVNPRLNKLVDSGEISIVPNSQPRLYSVVNSSSLEKKKKPKAKSERRKGGKEEVLSSFSDTIKQVEGLIQPLTSKLQSTELSISSCDEKIALLKQKRNEDIAAIEATQAEIEVHQSTLDELRSLRDRLSN